MTLEQKANHVTQAMATAAAEVGLIFVDGPNIQPVGLPAINHGYTNGQERYVFNAGVAEA